MSSFKKEDLEIIYSEQLATKVKLVPSVIFDVGNIGIEIGIDILFDGCDCFHIEEIICSADGLDLKLNNIDKLHFKMGKTVKDELKKFENLFFFDKLNMYNPNGYAIGYSIQIIGYKVIKK